VAPFLRCRGHRTARMSRCRGTTSRLCGKKSEHHESTEMRNLRPGHPHLVHRSRRVQQHDFGVDFDDVAGSSIRRSQQLVGQSSTWSIATGVLPTDSQ
jgi:hypothetical protein